MYLLIGYLLGSYVVKAQEEAMNKKPLSQEDYDLQSDLRYAVNLAGKEKMENTIYLFMMFGWSVLLLMSVILKIKKNK